MYNNLDYKKKYLKYKKKYLGLQSGGGDDIGSIDSVSGSIDSVFNGPISKQENQYVQALFKIPLDKNII